VAPDAEHARVAESATPTWAPESDLPEQALGFRVQAYGMTKHRDLFTDRQLVALTTFSDLVAEAREQLLRDAEAALAAGAWPPATGPACSASTDRSQAAAHQASTADSDGSARPSPTASAYADAVTTYLAFGLSKASSRNCTLAIWETGMNRLAGALGRQALPMTWDYAETNPIAGAGGDIAGTVAR
jgi:putative DNA methylase